MADTALQSLEPRRIRSRTLKLKTEILMDRDKLIGVALLGLVFLLFFTQMKKKQEQPAAPSKAAQGTVQTASAPSVGALNARPALENYSGENLTVVSNSLLSCTYDNELGDLAKVELFKSDVIKEIYDTLTKDSAEYELPIRLFSYGDLEGEKLSFNGGAGAFENTVVVTGVWNNTLLVTKTYTLSTSNYLTEVSLSLRNITGSVLPQNDLKLWLGTIDKLNEAKERPPVRSLTVSYINDSGKEKIKRFNPGKESKTLDGAITWASIGNRYFVHALAGKQQAVRLETGYRPDKKASWLSAVLTYSVPELKPGETYEWQGTLYTGPKQYERLTALDKEMVCGSDYVKIIDLGWYSIIATWMMQYGLKLTYRYVGSYGISIIILTVIIKLLLWPLTTKSTMAMKKMQKLQPEIKAIQEKYKDDPKKQQEEMMLLYRKYGYNPMGGCLPMLIQLPIFVALYQALSNAIELHKTPFLWIADLSMPDKVGAIFGFPIHPLAIAMGVGMVAQQMLTPKMGDASQQKMMYFMPIIFTVLFYNMPSGLVLYWFVNQLLTMAQTTYLQYKKD